MITKQIMTGVPPTRRELDSWWLRYEEAAAEHADMRAWLDANPYPTSNREHAADIRRRILEHAGQR
jgi:hypothetical protein